MAKKEDTKPSTEVTTVAAGAVAVAGEALDFAADAGAGMEGATQESFAIPFLGVLQKGSPQVDEAGPGPLIEGAKAGMLFDNITSRLYDGKKGVSVVPCAYRRVFLRWGARGTENSGFKGEILPEQVAALRAAGKIIEIDNQLYFPEEDGTIRRAKDGKVLCDKVADTRNHYVLLIDDETGAWSSALISLTSTQIKKSKALMSLLASVKTKGPNGLYTPPTFANVVRATSVAESNDKGNWYGIKFDMVGPVQRGDIYAAGKAFHASVAKGEVAAKYEDGLAPGEGSGDAGPSEGF
jgi:hypothetical protein